MMVKKEFLRGVLILECKDVFKKRILLPPSRFRILDYPRKPVAVFNPGAVIVEDEIHIFPRLIFDYYKYTSSIGHFKIGLKELLEENFPDVIDVEIIMWPKSREDLLGVEDPRAHTFENEIWILYTAKGFDKSSYERKDYLGFAKYNFNEVKRVGYFAIDMGNGPFFPKSNKDSTFLEINGNETRILTRPHFADDELSLWAGKADLENLVITDLKRVKRPLKHEEKLGWSTNSVKVDEKWIIGWHAVVKSDLSYRNGFAVINKNDFKFTDYKLCPNGLLEEYGDRALVIFGCGLISIEDNLIWVGGVSDYAIGIFIADRSVVLS